MRLSVLEPIGKYAVEGRIYQDATQAAMHALNPWAWSNIVKAIRELTPGDSLRVAETGRTVIALSNVRLEISDA